MGNEKEQEYVQQMGDFKTNFILPRMIKDSLHPETGIYSWLESLKMHDYTGSKARETLNNAMDRRKIDVREIQQKKKNKNNQEAKDDLEDAQGDDEATGNDNQENDYKNIWKEGNAALKDEKKEIVEFSKHDMDEFRNMRKNLKRQLAKRSGGQASSLEDLKRARNRDSSEAGPSNAENNDDN